MSQKREIRALLIETNNQVAAAIVALLRDRGVEVDVIDDLLRAESAIERYAPDIVIFDLPFYDGGEVIRGIRRRWRDLPLILCSAERPDVSDLLKDKRTTFIPKPFDGNTIMDAIHQMLRTG